MIECKIEQKYKPYDTEKGRVEEYERKIPGNTDTLYIDVSVVNGMAKTMIAAQAKDMHAATKDRANRKRNKYPQIKGFRSFIVDTMGGLGEEWKVFVSAAISVEAIDVDKTSVSDYY